MLKKMSNSPLNDSEMETMLRYRKLILELLCHHTGSERELNFQSFVIQREHKFVWCPVWTTLSSWFYDFLVIQVEEQPTWRDFLKGNRLKAVHDALEEGFEPLIIVREPFRGLVDVYLNRIYSKGLDSDWECRCKIAMQPHDRSNPIECPPTFPQFVNYVISRVELCGMLDVFWAPLNEFCSVCALNWSYILLYENLDVEGAFFLKNVRKMFP